MFSHWKPSGNIGLLKPWKQLGEGSFFGTIESHDDDNGLFTSFFGHNDILTFLYFIIFLYFYILTYFYILNIYLYFNIYFFNQKTCFP